jgi:hypothetical protein
MLRASLQSLKAALLDRPGVLQPLPANKDDSTLRKSSLDKPETNKDAVSERKQRVGARNVGSVSVVKAKNESSEMVS